MKTAIGLRDYQLDAIDRMKNGCILCGDVGSGKSRTAIGYYYKQYGGDLESRKFKAMDKHPTLYIITTARKRDTMEWATDLAPFHLSLFSSRNGRVVVDSWNNVQKYTNVRDAFFIFDEQRVVGKGKWVKSFLIICRFNKWILLSATPGDNWMDYVPVFLANRFYRNRTQFIREHVVYSPYSKFPLIDHYENEDILEQHRQAILVDMDFQRDRKALHVDVVCPYDLTAYKKVTKRWDIWDDCPIENPSKYCYLLRKVANADPSRLKEVNRILSERKKAVIFYNFDYELELLKKGIKPAFKVACWNGHTHEPIPECDQWAYLVQYAAGAEGWNCIATDTMIFYSQNYSNRTMHQAEGRIDRMNSPYKILIYYHLTSKSSIDLAIAKALKTKKIFNERGFINFASFKKEKS